MDENTNVEGRAPWVREAILAGQPFHIRTKSPLRHNTINLASLGALLASLALIAWSGTLLPALVFVPLGGLSFGLVYFAIFVLVVHEASHDMFVIGEDRALRMRLNRAFGWAVSIVFATHYTHHWEHGHHEHHVRPLEPNDPQQHNTLIGRTLLWRALACTFVPGFLFLDRTVLRKKAPGAKSRSTGSIILVFIALWATLLTTLTLTLGGSVAIAAFVGIQVLTGLNHVKGALEHGGALRDEPDPLFRSRSTFFPGRAVLMPFNISLHFEHHLNYSVPWYDLVRYHRALLPILPAALHTRVFNHRPLAQLTGALGGVSLRAASPLSSSGSRP